MEKTGESRFFDWRPFEIGIRRVQRVVEKVLRVLKVLKFDGPLARGLWYRPFDSAFSAEGSED